jgi:hypothetical protein
VHVVLGKIRANMAYNMAQARQIVLHCDRIHHAKSIVGISDTIYPSFAYSTNREDAWMKYPGNVYRNYSRLRMPMIKPVLRRNCSSERPISIAYSVNIARIISTRPMSVTKRAISIAWFLRLFKSSPKVPVSCLD